MNSTRVFQWLDALTDEEKAEAKRWQISRKESRGVHMPAEYILNDTRNFMRPLRK
ncbi:MAG: hypothetical protein ACLTW9_00010 [Enterocloster sp.]